MEQPHTNDAQPARPAFPPLYENADLVVFAKPPSMETISQTGDKEFTALLREERGEPGLTPVHRLDRDTSGAQLFARNPAAEKALTLLFRQRRTDKAYLALCLGTPRNRTGQINRNLSEWEGGRRPVRIVKKGGLEATTAYRLLASSPEGSPGLCLSLIAFFPHQGRTHQIRVHAAGFGYPILGDDQYGDRAANRSAREELGLRRQALHAARLAFPWEGAEVRVEAPLADDIRRAAQAALGGKTTLLADFFSSW